jgi:hypothetical protein
MRLPHADKVVVPHAKLVGYLLSFQHPYGRTKARFFTQLGFSTANWRDLKQAIKRIATTQQITGAMETPYGTKYIVDGQLPAASGAGADIRTVWFVEAGEEIPQFVTAYPLRTRQR